MSLTGNKYLSLSAETETSNICPFNEKDYAGSHCPHLTDRGTALLSGLAENCTSECKRGEESLQPSILAPVKQVTVLKFLDSSQS